ncbi:hypothetical protein CPB86DRAFT_811066 [Serendipita vermifera]|nr:hypothetical protein CPB86DRAFT_811066 [Serendipita vermifera]
MARSGIESIPPVLAPKVLSSEAAFGNLPAELEQINQLPSYSPGTGLSERRVAATSDTTARPLNATTGHYSIYSNNPPSPYLEHILQQIKDIHHIMEWRHSMPRRESTYFTYAQAVESVLYKARCRNRESSVSVMAIFIASISVALLACGQFYQEKLAGSKNSTLICRALLVNASFVLSATLSTFSVAYSLVSTGTFGRPNFIEVDNARRKLFKARAEGQAYDLASPNLNHFRRVILSPLKSLTQFLYPGLLSLTGETEHQAAVDREHPLTKEELEAVYVFESHLLSCQRKCETFLGLSLITLLPGIVGLSFLLMGPHYRAASYISLITILLATTFFLVIGFSLYYGAKITSSARELIKREASIS